MGLPATGTWREVVNTDAEVYGGSGVGNLGRVEATAEPMHGQPASAVLQVPPAGVLWLVLEDASETVGPTLAEDVVEPGAGPADGVSERPSPL